MPKGMNKQPTAKQPVPPKTDTKMYVHPPKGDGGIRDPGAFKGKVPA